ncbi:MAG: hypothetical protein H7Y22_03715 [Gemmatimonadaceae bacterium]|nr:hypothetical protein [Gloeobacterales cyanobacterium ES-bin-141]
MHDLTALHPTQAQIERWQAEARRRYPAFGMQLQFRHAAEGWEYSLHFQPLVSATRMQPGPVFRLEPDWYPLEMLWQEDGSSAVDFVFSLFPNQISLDEDYAPGSRQRVSNSTKFRAAAVGFAVGAGLVTGFVGGGLSEWSWIGAGVGVATATVFSWLAGLDPAQALGKGLHVPPWRRGLRPETEAHIFWNREALSGARWPLMLVTMLALGAATALNISYLVTANDYLRSMGLVGLAMGWLGFAAWYLSWPASHPRNGKLRPYGWIFLCLAGLELALAWAGMH